MLASEPDPTLPTPPVYRETRRRAARAPGLAEFALIATALLLLLWSVFGVLTLLLDASTGLGNVDPRLVGLVILSGLGSLACLWLAWRQAAARTRHSGPPVPGLQRRTSNDWTMQEAVFVRLLYCERDHIVFDPQTGRRAPVQWAGNSVTAIPDPGNLPRVL